jgi:hypothetical protein
MFERYLENELCSINNELIQIFPQDIVNVILSMVKINIILKPDKNMLRKNPNIDAKYISFNFYKNYRIDLKTVMINNIFGFAYSMHNISCVVVMTVDSNIINFIKSLENICRKMLLMEYGITVKSIAHSNILTVKINQASYEMNGMNKHIDVCDDRFRNFDKTNGNTDNKVTFFQLEKSDNDPINIRVGSKLSGLQLYVPNIMVKKRVGKLSAILQNDV